MIRGISLSTPSDIESYLTTDEKIIMMTKTAWEIYATNKRLIFKKKRAFGGKEIIDASYHHISSIEYEKKMSVGYIISGICIAIFAVAVLFLNPRDPSSWFGYGTLVSSWIDVFSIGLIILGLILTLIGVAHTLGPPILTIHIVGRKPIITSGKELEEMIKITRKYEEKLETSRKESP
jgi:hypothetical protein